METKVVENASIRAREMRGQAVMELLGIYGWAFVLIAVFAALLYVYVSLPSSIAPTSCNFSTMFYCRDVTIATYASNGVTVMAINAINMLQYTVANPSITVRFDNMNTTSASCTPNIVPAGGSTVCMITLPANTTVGQFVSGSLYMSAQNCGMDPHYLATKSCTNVPAQLLTGSFTGHTAALVTTSFAAT